MANSAVSIPTLSSISAFQNNPIYPKILTSDSKMSHTIDVGQITIDSGIKFVWRGGVEYTVDNFTRTFITEANKTYHLRWQWNNNSPQIVLKDLADTEYNPSALSEENTEFDTDFDDMLIARVVTDGSNNLTVTQLENQHQLWGNLSDAPTTNITNNEDNTARGEGSFTFDWSRKPKNFTYHINETQTDGTPSGTDNDIVFENTTTRYGTDYSYVDDFKDFVDQVELQFNFSA